MADKRIDELEAAASVTTNDLFVLEQAGTAKKLEAFTLETWLLQLAQGHGGITGIAKTGTAGTNPVVDTYTITFSDTSTTTFDVTNGVKGDTGDQTYVYIKYSNREPIADSDLTDTPSAWMGICATTAATAPTTYGSYSWYEIKGDKGDPGNDITISSTSVMYQAWTSGTQYPTGTWLANPPAVTPGNYLWTRTIVNYSDGGQTVSYSVGRWGLDGSGAVASVNGELPDQNGNVTLTAANVGALPDSYQPPVTSVNNKTGTVVLDNEDVNAPYGKSVSANLSTAGWYRILTIDEDGFSSGNLSSLISLRITRKQSGGNGETHSIDISHCGSSSGFANETSVSSLMLIDKIRLTYTSGIALYADIHYNSSSSFEVNVDMLISTIAGMKPYIISQSLTGVADAPTGETVMTTYTFMARTDSTGSISGGSDGKAVYGDGYSYLFKRNGIVYVRAYCVTKSISSGGWRKLATVPAGFRPPLSHDFTGINNGDDTLIHARATTDGELNVWPLENIGDGTTVILETSYITNA